MPRKIEYEIALFSSHSDKEHLDSLLNEYLEDEEGEEIDFDDGCSDDAKQCTASFHLDNMSIVSGSCHNTCLGLI